MRLRRSRPERELATHLRRVPLLASVSERDLQRLAESATRRRYVEGEVIVAEGESGSAFFVLIDGSAAVSVDGELVGGLSACDTFGEIAAVGSCARTATVVAATDVECLVLPPWHLRGFLATHAGVAFALARKLAGFASRREVS